MNSKRFSKSSLVLLISVLSTVLYSQTSDTISRLHKVSLKEAHKGDLEVDTKLLDSYGYNDKSERDFYIQARKIFADYSDADFTNEKILEAARKNRIQLLGGPMLGDLRSDGVTLWLRPATKRAIKVKVKNAEGKRKQIYQQNDVEPGVEQRIVLNGLSPNNRYEYKVFSGVRKVAEGSFKTAPLLSDKESFSLVFGSCFHKIGLHNPNLMAQIIKREPYAMMLLGDLAVDDRENRINMHRSDYLLRDLSKAWQNLSSRIPLYTSWDDHDYLNNDLSGTPERFTQSDVEALREVWMQNWNNPENFAEGIYFSSRLGPVEIIMLDTRSCRTISQRGQFNSYLGNEQLNWLKGVLKNSTAPYKIVSSGTMWSDYITPGKDSWGTWDTLAREEIFKLIETESIPGVLLVSGDRHGARGFTIPRKEGYDLYEFEAASLGGVPGPPAFAKDSSNQLFGYPGKDLKAFGEFTIRYEEDLPVLIFRLIDEQGVFLEEHIIPYTQLRDFVY